jgi:hypothetical protein
MSPPTKRLARRRAERGQTLVLAVLMMLVVVLTVFLTFAIGARTRRKIQLQAVADSTAYSLAVAEARAFNFYAWSNRALVAHHISILSVHAHQSYLSFYEDVLAATGRNFRNIAKQLTSRCAAGSQESCLAAPRARRISDIYQHSYFKPEEEWPHICDPITHECRVDLECVGDDSCDLESAKKRGADWFHDVWHEKAGSNSCFRLLEGSRDHFRKVQLLRAHQLRVEAQLQLMMTGNLDDAHLSSTEDALLDRSTRRAYYPEQVSRKPLTEMSTLSLAQNLARLTDPELKAHESAGRVSLGYYQTAVDNGLRYNLHKDYDEILDGTRFPGFITQRGFRADPNWKRLDTAAKKAARGTGVPSTEVENEGTARMLKVGAGQVDPGTRNWLNPHQSEWPPSYPGDIEAVPPNKQNPPPAGKLPYGGEQLAKAAHREGHDQFGFGESDGAAAEDHGRVRSQFQLPSGAIVRAHTDIRAGRNGVWGDPHDWDGPTGSADPHRVHSFHLFHGDLGPVSGHGQDLGDCTGPGCNQEMRRGLYRGHMRFRLANLRQPGDLWNMPRTLSLITRPARDARPSGEPWPWEFHFQAQLPGPVRFTTLESAGDKETDNTMAALAAGLVYFHKPPNSGEEYGEAPNLWNPFWRAKLHPVKQADAIRATEGVHQASWLLLNGLYRWSAVNY